TIAAALDMPPSTLAHHLSTLCASGLIHQERRGREIVNQVDFKLMERTVRFLTDECCSGPPLALHAEARSFHPGCGPSEDAR
ncbi:MAG: helix-turn-helix domain-containing protein, partial [Pseudomonadota bacterium]